MAVGCHRGRVLVPAIRLACATGVAQEDLEHDVRADRVCLLPAIRHRAAIVRIGEDEDDKLAIDAQVARIGGVVIPKIGEITRDLGDARIASRLRVVIVRPLEASASRTGQECRHALVAD